MKKITLRKTLALCALLLTGYTASAQAPEIEWQKTYGGTLEDTAYNIKQTLDGGFITIGYSRSNDGTISENHGLSDCWIAKLDQAGNVEWQKLLGGTKDDVGHCVQQTSDGGYVIAGTTWSNDGDISGNHGSWDYFVMKLNNNGDIQWQKCLGGSYAETGYSIQQTFDGGYVVFGTTGSNNGNVTNFHGSDSTMLDCWLVKLNTSGTIEWQKALGGSNIEYAYSVQQTTDGGYILAGMTTSNDGDVTDYHGDEDFWIVKVNSTGIIEWQKTLGGTGNDRACSVQQTTDGGYVATGWSNSTDGDITGNHGNHDYWVVKLNSNGNLIWQKSIGGTGNDEGNFITQTADGGFAVTGRSSSTDSDVTINNGAEDIWTVKLDAIGNIMWQTSSGGSEWDQALCIQKTIDGGLILAGLSYSDDNDISINYGTSDIWVVKLSPDGTTATQEVAKNTLTLYPNPNNGTFTIGGDIVLENATLNVYSTLGQLEYSSKVTKAAVSLPNLAAGFYQVRLTTAKASYSQKLIIE